MEAERKGERQREKERKRKEALNSGEVPSRKRRGMCGGSGINGLMAADSVLHHFTALAGFASALPILHEVFAKELLYLIPNAVPGPGADFGMPLAVCPGAAGSLPQPHLPWRTPHPFQASLPQWTGSSHAHPRPPHFSPIPFFTPGFLLEVFSTIPSFLGLPRSDQVWAGLWEVVERNQAFRNHWFYLGVRGRAPKMAGEEARWVLLPHPSVLMRMLTISQVIADLSRNFHPNEQNETLGRGCPRGMGHGVRREPGIGRGAKPAWSQIPGHRSQLPSTARPGASVRAGLDHPRAQPGWSHAWSCSWSSSGAVPVPGAVPTAVLDLCWSCA